MMQPFNMLNSYDWNMDTFLMIFEWPNECLTFPFGTKCRHCIWLPFRRLPGNNISGHYFHHYVHPVFSSIFFSIAYTFLTSKNLLMGAPRNLWVNRVGHFGVLRFSYMNLWGMIKSKSWSTKFDWRVQWSRVWPLSRPQWPIRGPLVAIWI